MKNVVLSALFAVGWPVFLSRQKSFHWGDYVELTDNGSRMTGMKWSKMIVWSGFVGETTDVRWQETECAPMVKATGTLRLKAWKGERVNAIGCFDAERTGRRKLPGQ